MSGYTFILHALCLVCLVACQPAPTEGSRTDTSPKNRAKLTVAVATNFLPAFEDIQQTFESSHSYDVIVVSGSTGKLYTHIINGAPFDIFFAADQARPYRLVDLGLADSTQTYARGRLCLVSLTDMTQGWDALRFDTPLKLAIANPALAPYGVAARDVFEDKGVWQSAQDHLVYGENVGQALSFVMTGNADYGLVSCALAMKAQQNSSAFNVHAWQVPQTWHRPILQDAVIIRRDGADDTTNVTTKGSKSLLEFILSSQTQSRIVAMGYADVACQGGVCD